MLSLAAIRATEPRSHRYTLTDGNGLSLQVLPSGAKYWRFRYRFDRRAKMLSLGTYPDTSLDAARDRLAKARDLLARHIDPSAHRPDETAARQITFEYLLPKNRNAADQLSRTTGNSHRTEGDRIEGGLYNTAHRVRQICSKVFQFALVRGYVTTNAADAVRGLLEPLRHRHAGAAVADLVPLDVIVIDASFSNDFAFWARFQRRCSGVPAGAGETAISMDRRVDSLIGFTKW